MGTNAFSRDVSLQTFGWASLILRSSPQKVKQEAWLLLLYKINTRPSRGPPQHRALPLSEAFFQSNSWQIYTETAPYLGSTQLLQAPLHLKICPSSPPPSIPTCQPGSFHLNPVQEKQILNAKQKAKDLVLWPKAGPGEARSPGRQPACGSFWVEGRMCSCLLTLF